MHVQSRAVQVTEIKADNIIQPKPARGLLVSGLANQSPEDFSRNFQTRSLGMIREIYQSGNKKTEEPWKS